MLLILGMMVLVWRMMLMLMLAQQCRSLRSQSCSRWLPKARPQRRSLLRPLTLTRQFG
jgi:hypothetical protein